MSGIHWIHLYKDTCIRTITNWSTKSACLDAKTPYIACVCLRTHRCMYSIQCSDKVRVPQLHKCGVAKSCPGTHTALQALMRRTKMTIFSSFSANFPPHYHTTLTINCVHASNWFTHLQPIWQSSNWCSKWEFCCYFVYIMAYGSTPYVGMIPEKNGGHIKSAQMTRSKCLR